MNTHLPKHRQGNDGKDSLCIFTKSELRTQVWVCRAEQGLQRKGCKGKVPLPEHILEGMPSASLYPQMFPEMGNTVHRCGKVNQTIAF